jgi:RecA-family ATPase
MPIENIEEHENKEFPNIESVEKIMEIYIPDVINGVPNRNGFIWVLAGSGGSGKTSMLLNFFR